MIECEICGRFSKADETEACPNSNCSLNDLCPRCYEKHVTSCMLGLSED